MSALMDIIVQTLWDIQNTKYSALSSASIVIFDHLVTLDDEIDLIWRSPWSGGKILFFANRYYVLFATLFNTFGLFSKTLSDSFCYHFLRWQGYTGLICCVLAECILQMRLYALFCLNKRVLVLMVSTLILSTAASAVILTRVLGETKVFAHVLPGDRFCTPIGVSPDFYGFWIPILFSEALLCGLAIFRGFQTFNAEGSIFQTGRRLVAIMIRDSVLYFVAMFATYSTALFVWVFGRSSLIEIPIGFTVAMSCVLSNRIIFNIRRLNLRIKQEEEERLSAMARSLSMRRRSGTSIHTSFFSGRTRSYQVAVSNKEESGLEDGADLPFPSFLTDVEMAELRSMRADPDIVL